MGKGLPKEDGTGPEKLDVIRWWGGGRFIKKEEEFCFQIVKIRYKLQSLILKVCVYMCVCFKVAALLEFSI